MGSTENILTQQGGSHLALELQNMYWSPNYERDA
jgi:hypothetical protein